MMKTKSRLNTLKGLKATTGLMFIIAGMAIFSCQIKDELIDKTPITEELNKEEMEVDTTVRYLALGDSYTIGEGVDEVERWPNQLAAKLKSNNIAVDCTKIIAETGWTTNDLILAIGNANPKEFNFVSLLIGVNNQYQHIPFETFKSEFVFLLNKSIQLAGSSRRVFVVSIPDYGVTPFGRRNAVTIAEELDMYNRYISDQCNEKSIPFINVTEISRQLGNSDRALASDGLHPSGAQYTKWVEEILPEALKLVSN